VTQSNAGAANEMAATAEQLSTEAGRLEERAGYFRMTDAERERLLQDEAVEIAATNRQMERRKARAAERRTGSAATASAGAAAPKPAASALADPAGSAARRAGRAPAQPAAEDSLFDAAEANPVHRLQAQAAGFAARPVPPAAKGGFSLELDADQGFERLSR
jgi:methyl-accepting chemotaxis protein